MNVEEIRKLRPGLSGLMRAKNEARFIGACIDSVVEALDELIVVYNDCTDQTEAVLRSKVKQYGDKIKIYPFNHNVLVANLTKEQYEYAVSLPEDSPRLHCTQCNYALDHASYQYAVKIDPDQIYFTDEVKKWREICRGKKIKINVVQIVLAECFRLWFSLYRRMSLKRGRVCDFLMPDWLVRTFGKFYIDYGCSLLQKGKISVAWSGINVFIEDEKIFIPYDFRNVHPPYNGEGDLVLFKINSMTRYGRYMIPGDKTRVLEYFNNPYPMCFAGAMWFHLHANRDYCAANVSQMRRENPELFVCADEFVEFSYKDSLARMHGSVPTLFQRTLFLWIHKISMPIVRRNLKKLRPLVLGVFYNLSKG